MTKQQAIDFFGGQAKDLAEVLAISNASVSQWKEIPIGRQYQIEILSYGNLKADRPAHKAA